MIGLFLEGSFGLFAISYVILFKKKLKNFYLCHLDRKGRATSCIHRTSEIFLCLSQLPDLNTASLNRGLVSFLKCLLDRSILRNLIDDKK